MVNAMIFLSHNYKDKAFVEHIARILEDIYGRERIFYDSWSIQPGDGIIDKMNSGLEKAEFFFFFITGNSLASKMVTMEWQNALMKSTQTTLKFIPIKCDDSIVPALLTQNLYLDLYSNGVESVSAQMKDIIDGESTFKPEKPEFSNLSYDLKVNDDNSIILHISAGYFLEPIPDCLLLFEDDLDQNSYSCTIDENMYSSGFQKDLKLDNGTSYDAIFVAVNRGITKKIPMIVSLSRKDGNQLRLKLVLHKKETNKWVEIPRVLNKNINPGIIDYNNFPMKF